MIIIGIDEVGRGCWAGPLVAAAVALDTGKQSIPGLDDSKKLTRVRRETLNETIKERAVACGIGWVRPADIDKDGLTQAVRTAMESAVTEVLMSLTVPKPVTIIIDGSYNFLKDYDLPASWRGKVQITTLVGGDGLVPAVSAASIIAKVARDAYMAQEAHRTYPEYGFAKHVGYGTAAHIAALAKHGVTPIHRLSYKPIQKIMLQFGTS